jgi:hypothetical protein
MRAKLVFVCALGVGLIGSATAGAARQLQTAEQTGPMNGRDYMRDRVLDALFPLDVPQRPYLWKVTLRFGDSATQIVAVVYSNRLTNFETRCDLIRFSLDGLGPGELDAYIERMTRANPRIAARDIAGTLRVKRTTTPIEPSTLDSALAELRSLRLSPVLSGRMAVDNYAQYELWYETWQEMNHFQIISPVDDTGSGQLARWMVKFRDDLPTLLKSPAQK